MPPEDAAALAPPPRQLFVAPMGEIVAGDDKQEKLVDRWFAGADADHDGALTLAEFRADARAWFGRLDGNRDGRIDAEEVRLYEVMLRRAAAGSGRPGRPRGPRVKSTGTLVGAAAGDAAYADILQGAARFGLLNIPQPVAAADADFDRSITPAEFDAAARRRFAMLDPDDTGAVSRKDLPRL
ncbi:hypothetical protein IP88_13875 [alpha proteobacterium AAP81b]|nr:hypothetical protein IP88_13875 [alpha proteobacterium AAP81b]